MPKCTPCEVESLQKIIGYYFVDLSWLLRALTHRSEGEPNNEKLEFIGDSILNYAGAMMLYEQFPHLSEGELSLLRAKLVNKNTLSDIAQSIQLGRYLRLGEGEIKSGGAQRPSILADALEALFAAVCFDADFSTAEKVVRHLLLSRVLAMDITQPIKDAKTILQETLQSHHLALPQYHVVHQSTDNESPWFNVTCEIEALSLCVTGQGNSKRGAEQEAAQVALDSINDRW